MCIKLTILFCLIVLLLLVLHIVLGWTDVVESAASTLVPFVVYCNVNQTKE